MSLISNNISPLAFYDDISLQNHRKDYAFGQIKPLITYSNTLLPFQIVLRDSASTFAVMLYRYETDSYIDITRSMRENGLAIRECEGYKILKYPGILPIKELKFEGLYHLVINMPGFGSIYSEVFSSCNRVDDYLKLRYKNQYNFELPNGVVDFSEGFTFECYLDTQVGKPDYNFEEEATERMGYTFIESQVSKKLFRFVFTAPEYLCDALRVVRLCSDKQILSKKRLYDASTFNMDVDWQDQGDIASVECEFETDTVIANIGGYKPEILGDFNNDFSNDFNNK